MCIYLYKCVYIFIYTYHCVFKMTRSPRHCKSPRPAPPRSQARKQRGAVLLPAGPHRMTMRPPLEPCPCPRRATVRLPL